MYEIEELVNLVASRGTSACVDGRYVAARPIPFGGWTHRLKDAWEVFWGRADAVKWEGQ